MRALLVMDTAHEILSLGLMDLDSRQTYTSRLAVGNRHGEVFFEALNALLARAQASREDIAAVGFGAGPGSFTGLRIACGIAQGLGWALECPLVPLNNLEIYALAYALHTHPETSEVLVAQDARMGEIYAQRFRVKEEFVEALDEPVLLKPEEVPSLMTSETQTVLGSAVSLYPTLGEGVRRVEEAFDINEAMLQLASQKLERGMTVTPQEAYPHYVRNRVALTIEERARGEKL